MARTYASLLTVIQNVLQDTGASVWTTAELDVHIPEAITEISRKKPYLTKLTVYTTADALDITLTDGDKHRLLWIDRAEYEIDQSPREFRNISRWGDVVTLDMDDAPSESDESVYLWVAQKHRLQKQIGTTDTAGALNAAAAAGAVSLDLKSLGTGTINKDTVLTIAGDTTEYMVIADATIDTNAATVSIYPKLAAAAAEDAVVTLALSESTLDDGLETVLVNYVAGKAAISKSRAYINKINTGGAGTPNTMEQWGRDKLALAMADLRLMSPVNVKRRYAR
jgi:hypothetical protein